MSTSRDARLLAAILVWIGAVLLLDVRASFAQQCLLGAGTWVLLLLLLRAETPLVRAQVGVVVVFATVVEYVFSGWLGVYEYRLHTVPMFVPPGHGLVYLAALSAARTTFVRRHARQLLAVVLVAGGAWAVWGLALSPQPDALGAFWYGCLLLFVWRGRSPLVYIGAFAVVSYLEILGTSVGTWRWGPVDPVLHLLTIGNPPSGIAGGYAWFDAAALRFAPAVVAVWARWRGGVPAGEPTTVARAGRDADERAVHSRGPLDEAA